MKYFLSLLPILFFIGFLIYLDSFKLVRFRLLLICYLWGATSAILSYYSNSLALQNINISLADYSWMVAPVIEEVIKASFLIYLFRANKVGFLIDAAILGFTIGAGFAFVENIYYLINLSGSNLMIWIIRGFGTAIMHCGTTAIVALMVVSLSKKINHLPVKSFLSGLLLAILIHSVYNQFLINPLISTLLIMMIVPVSIALVFSYGEKKLRDWMEIELYSEVSLLTMIKTGEFSATNAGKYILSIKDRFSRESIVDILNFIRLYLELSIKAKSMLLLQEAGFPFEKDKDIEEKLIELGHLQKAIGRTGFYALTPILRLDRKSFWKISLLKQ